MIGMISRPQPGLQAKTSAAVPAYFPNEESIMRLLGAVLAEQNEEWLLQSRYLPQQSMAEITRVSDEVIEALPLNLHHLDGRDQHLLGDKEWRHLITLGASF